MLRDLEILSLLPTAAVVLDRLGRCIYANPRWYELSGLGPEASAGGGWERALHADDLRQLRCELKRCAHRGEWLVQECRLQPADEPGRWVRLSARPITPDSQPFAGCLLTFEDVTDYKPALAELRETQEFHEALFESAPVGLAWCGPDGRIRRANRRLCEIMGYAAEELIGERLEALTPPDQSPAENRSHGLVKSYRRKDGALVRVNVLTSYPESPSSNVNYLLRVVVEASATDTTRAAQPCATPAEMCALEALTPRQREVLRLIAEGHSTKEIAHLLSISVKTVETHRKDLMERLGISGLARLIRFALRTGVVSAES